MNLGERHFLLDKPVLVPNERLNPIIDFLLERKLEQHPETDPVEAREELVSNALKATLKAGISHIFFNKQVPHSDN